MPESIGTSSPGRGEPPADCGRGSDPARHDPSAESVTQLERRASVALSLVIPAYNEAVRLPPYLDSIRRHFDPQYGEHYEVIVVDDGSSDQLASVLSAISRDWPQLGTIRHSHNLGKGAAVRTGVLAARGGLILFADADGATPITEHDKLRLAIGEGADVAVGSRLLDDDQVVRTRTWRRAIIGRTFAALARRMVSVVIRDTQCGFKMFRAEAGRRLFELVREQGYLFDIELLALAKQLNLIVVEVPINWSDQPGSQMNMRRESGKIVAGLFRIRRRLKRQLADYDKD